MNVEILDIYKENSTMCFLVKGTLEDFIKSLEDDYREYEVQREIVSNDFLDDLVETVLEKKHIPNIVLVYDGEVELSKFQKGNPR